MSMRYKGGVISATPPTTTGGNSGVASGNWTLEQQFQAQGSGNWPNQPVWYIEDVFSTYLYTGNGSTQTITNGIDLSTKGGLVWIKGRSVAYSHAVFDTARGATNRLVTNATDANSVETGTLTAFNSTGFALGSTGAVNNNGTTFASWTFRKQPKFFDVVTYTGNGTSQNIAHNLGSVPGCMIVKSLGTVNQWSIYHQDLGPSYGVWFTTAVPDPDAYWDNTSPTSTAFTVGPKDGTNTLGVQYVAYLFAHNAGGFGLTGTDNVISCGSFTTNGSGQATVSLGYEPQLILWKRTDSTSDWYILDTMRGLTADPANSVAGLRPNLSNAETTALTGWSINATGFGWSAGAASATYIYIAIRRGPMKTPTTGTSVYYAQAYADASLGSTNPTNLGASAGFPVDFFMHSMREETTFCSNIFDRLRGSNPALITSGADAESTGEPLNAFNNAFDIMSGVKSAYDNRFYYYLTLGRNHIAWMFRRAPGFFDTVCYTGTGVARTVNHNLGVTPELLIVKIRTGDSDAWTIWNTTIAGISPASYLTFSTAARTTNANRFNSTAPTSSVFTVGTNGSVNGSGWTYVAYLFASCPGVSKVGSYTGTGTTQQINCGFTGGARFVLIKRTDSTGGWYVWDSARGIVAGDDPYLLLNSTAAEVTNTDYVDTFSSGFEISSTAPAEINANGGTFIYLAIA